MKLRLSSFIFLFSSFALLNTASAQWIIDGQRVQSLEIHVSDPQAFYADGSRPMTAPIVFSVSSSGLFRATVPWSGEQAFFIADEGEEVLRLSDGDTGLQLGSLILKPFVISQTSEGTTIDFGEHMLSGGWQIDEVLPYPEAIINRGYADTRYLLRTTGITTNRVIQAGNTLVISNGLITAILP
jgi:hypothetical protein